MPKFRKKPVVIEAEQVIERTFGDLHPNPEHFAGVIYDPVSRTARIETLEGTMTANLGDWIIKGVKGELYPIKDSIFRETYEAVRE